MQDGGDLDLVGVASDHVAVPPEDVDLVRDLVGRVRLIHAVDSLSACEQLESRRIPGATIDCLLQVNVAGEDTKAGVAPADTLLAK